MKKFALVSLLLSGFLFGTTTSQRQEERLSDLNYVRNIFLTSYAPMEWKEAYYSFKFEEAYQNAKNTILNHPELTTREYHGLIKRYAATLNDYHVGISFDSSEFSSLPFEIVGAEGRYFIHSIDRSQFFYSSYIPFIGFKPSVGDEVIAFNGEPIHAAVTAIRESGGVHANEATDFSLAEINLIYRSGTRADETPNGSATITVKAKNGRIGKFTINWDYKPETFKHPHDFLESWFDFSSTQKKSKPLLSKTCGYSMLFPDYLCMDRQKAGFNRKVRLGDEKGFLPPLGNVIWKYVRNYNRFSSDTDPISAYLYTHSSGKIVGYLRIASFSDLDTKELALIVDKMESSADLLVIDQLDNPGGSVDILFEALSLFAIQDLILIKDAFKLNYEIIRGHIHDKHLFEGWLAETEPFVTQIAKNLEEWEQLLELKRLRKEITQQLLFINMQLDEWNKGRSVTYPMYMLNKESVFPHSSSHYTKPLIVLINELDISCADCFPAILKDNGRATLFGTRTAGAGGAVSGTSFDHSRTGIKEIHYTTTVGNRMNNAILEDLGVEPDVEYKVTPDDLQNGYQGYISALNALIEKTLN